MTLADFPIWQVAAALSLAFVGLVAIAAWLRFRLVAMELALLEFRLHTHTVYESTGAIVIGETTTMRG